LKEVAAKAEVQYLRLNDTRVGLEQARTTLVTTSNTLVATESSLAETKDTLKKTETSLTAAKDDATQKADQIASLNQQKSALETDAEQKKAEMAKLVEKLSEKETSLEAAKRYVSKLERDISMMMNGSSETNAPPPGLQGQILVVNTNWNFVVVDVMEEGRVLPRTDLTIQRDNKLVGKVRISEVISDRRFAFGEILEDWQQLPVAKGDYVFY
jgi:predicted nuclease with TOPRIM domain